MPAPDPEEPHTAGNHFLPCGLNRLGDLQSGDRHLYYDADGTGRRAQVLVATIGDTVHPALAFYDFLIMA